MLTKTTTTKKLNPDTKKNIITSPLSFIAYSIWDYESIDPLKHPEDAPLN